jgi:hypothetical protein
MQQAGLTAPGPSTFSQTENAAKGERGAHSSLHFKRTTHNTIVLVHRLNYANRSQTLQRKGSNQKYQADAAWHFSIVLNACLKKLFSFERSLF